MKLEEFKFNEELIDWYQSVYKDIWIDNEYERFGLKIRPGDIVVDCGANIGIFSTLASTKQAEKVISIELDENNFEFLKLNTQRFNNIKPILGAVSSQSFSLERIMSDFNLKRIDFLKVDIEGWEYDFIVNATDESLMKVDKISAELHLWSMFDNYIEDHVLASNTSKKCLDLLDKLSRLNFDIKLTKVHTNSCLYMLYAKKN